MQRCIALLGTDVVRTTKRNIRIFEQVCPIVNSKLVASIASQTAFFNERTQLAVLFAIAFYSMSPRYISRTEVPDFALNS
jgi:hypothetical protein